MPAVHKNFFLILLSLRTSMTSEQPIQFRYRYRPIYWYSRYEKSLSVLVIGIGYRYWLSVSVIGIGYRYRHWRQSALNSAGAL